MKKLFALCMAAMMLFATGCETQKEKELTLPSYEDVLLEKEQHGWGYRLSTGDEEINHYTAKYFFFSRTSMEGCFFLSSPGEEINIKKPGETPSILEAVFAVDYERSSSTILTEQILLKFNKIDGELRDLTLSCQGQGVISLELDKNNCADVKLKGVTPYNTEEKVENLGITINGILTHEGVDYEFSCDL